VARRKVFVTGASGQLGRDVVIACTAAGDDVHGLGHQGLDVTDRDAVIGLLTHQRPDLVVHCAAWTAVDACEADRERAQLTNADAVRHVVDGCAEVGARLVHVSTDYVFDGTKPSAYVETDPTNPMSVYGETKLGGERAALALGDAAAIVRTSWVCGEHGANMVKTILRLAADRPELQFVADQVGHPTFTADLAPLLRRIGVDELSGVIHATNQGAVSWFEFAREVVAASGRDPEMVQPIATADLQPPRPAPRPANSVLDNAALRAADVPLLRDFREPLAELVARLS
jgi:dTDP-4-dehydrorhamnose reductase